jgi:hypothetical protein
MGNQSSLFFISPDKVVRPNKRQASSQMIFENESSLGGGGGEGEENGLLNSSAKRSRKTPVNGQQTRFSGHNNYNNLATSSEAMLQQSAKKAYDRHAAMVGIRSPSMVLTYPRMEATETQEHSNESISRAALNEKTNIANVYVPPSKRNAQQQEQQQQEQQQNQQERQQPSGLTSIPAPRQMKRFPAPRAL